MIAEALQCSDTRLRYLSQKSELFYYSSGRRRVGSKYRNIYAPTKRSKKSLTRLARLLSRFAVIHPHAFGSQKGRGRIEAAKLHNGKYVSSRDVQNCYPSVTKYRFRYECMRMGFSCEVAEILSGLLTVHGRLPHGSPASAVALDIFFSRYDHIIFQYALRRQCMSSRYVDDTKISGNDQVAVSLVTEMCERLTKSLGLQINLKKKAESQSWLTPRDSKNIHGVKVNHTGQCMPTTESQSDLLKAIESYRKLCKSVQPSGLKNLHMQRRSIQGRICCIRDLDTAEILSKVVDGVRSGGV